MANSERLVQECHQAAKLGWVFWDRPLVAILDKLVVNLDRLVWERFLVPNLDKLAVERPLKANLE